MSEALLGMNTSRDKDLDLTTLHPRFEILSKLKDIFVDRVDPVLKILHVPSFWAGLNQALNDPQPMSKSMQAEAFSFYYTAIGASDELQCKRLFGEGKIVMLPRYRVACQRALVEASFLATTSIATLRAYALYLVSIAATVLTMDLTSTLRFSPNMATDLKSYMCFRRLAYVWQGK